MKKILSILCFLLLCLQVFGQESITLMWDACTDTNVAGYVIYHGPVGSGITNSTVLDAATTTATVSNLVANTTYFFFVTAYDAQFLESDPSNVIFDTPLPTSGGTNYANAPPVLNAIPDQTVEAGQLLHFVASALDTNIPVQTLTFSLGAGPVGASIHPSTGVFSWTPPLNKRELVSVVVQVSDNGSPVMSDAQTVFINVTSATPTNALHTNLMVIKLSRPVYHDVTNYVTKTNYITTTNRFDIPHVVYWTNYINVTNGSTINLGGMQICKLTNYTSTTNIVFTNYASTNFNVAVAFTQTPYITTVTTNVTSTIHYLIVTNYTIAIKTTNATSKLTLIARATTKTNIMNLDWTCNLDWMGYIISYGNGGQEWLFSVSGTNEAKVTSLTSNAYYFCVTPFDASFKRGNASAYVTNTPGTSKTVTRTK